MLVNVQNMTFKSSESCFFFLDMTDVGKEEKNEWKVRMNTFSMTGAGNHVVFYNYIYIYIRILIHIHSGIVEGICRYSAYTHFFISQLCVYPLLNPF